MFIQLLALSAFIQLALCQDSYKIPIRVDGKSFEVVFPVNISPAAAASEFCKQNGYSDLQTCVPPISNYLQNAVQNLSTPLTTVRLTVDSNTYEVRFNPNTEPIGTVARNFCVSQAGSLKIPLTEEGVANCAKSVGEYIFNDVNSRRQAAAPVQQAPAKPASDILTVQLTVDSNTYEVRFNPNTEPIGTVARNFCASQAGSLKIPLTEEGVANCAKSVGEYIFNDVNSRRQAAAPVKQAPAKPASAPAGAGELIAVQLTVDDNTYEIRFNPNTEAVGAVARNFCISQAGNLKLAGTEEAVGSCAKTVGEYIVNNVNSRRQAAAPAKPKAAPPSAPPSELITVRLTVDENTFEIRFDTNKDTLSAVAVDFCTSQASVLKIPLTQEGILQCSTSVAEYIVKDVNSRRA